LEQELHKKHAAKRLFCIAQWVPSTGTLRHRYYRVLASNSPLRGAMAAMAQVVEPMVVSGTLPGAFLSAFTP